MSEKEGQQKKKAAMHTISTYRNRLKTGTRALQGVFLESMYCCLSPAGASSIHGRRGYPPQGVPKFR